MDLDTLADGDLFDDPTADGALRRATAAPHGRCLGCDDPLEHVDRCAHCDRTRFVDRAAAVGIGRPCTGCGQHGRVTLTWCRPCRWSPQVDLADLPTHLTAALD